MRGRIPYFYMSLALLLPPAALALVTSDPNPQAPTWAEATYILTLPSITHLSFEGDLLVHKTTLDGNVYTARDMRDSYNGISRYAGQKIGDEFVQEAESSISSTLRSSLRRAFPHSTLLSLSSNVDRNSLLRAGTDGEYDPPVLLKVQADLRLDPGEYGLGEYSDRAFEAALRAGARISLSLDLPVDEGFNATYILSPPVGASIVEIEGGKILGTNATFSQSAWKSPTPRDISGSVVFADPRAPTYSHEDVQTTVHLLLPSLSPVEGRVPLRLNVTVELRVIDLNRRVPLSIPPKISLPYLNADGIRSLIKEGAISPSTLDLARSEIKDRIERTVTLALGVPVSSQGGFVPSSLEGPPSTPYDTEPPILLRFESSSSLGVESASPDQIQKALDAGATIVIPLEVSAPAGEKVVLEIELPQGLSARIEDGAEGPTPNVALLETDNRQGSTEKRRETSLRVRDSLLSAFDSQKAWLNATFDLDVDVSPLGALQGNYGALDVDATIEASLLSLEVPGEIRSSLPPRVELSYVGSDAIRRLWEKGEIDTRRMDELEGALRENATSALSRALDVPVEVSGGIVRSTLSSSSRGPILVALEASARKPLGRPPSPAALSLYILDQSFVLPKIDGFETRYEFILPPGFAVASGGAMGGSFATSREGLRESFVVTPESSSSQVRVMISVTPLFLLFEFGYLLLGGILLLVILVGGVLLLRRKKLQKT